VEERVLAQSRAFPSLYQSFGAALRDVGSDLTVSQVVVVVVVVLDGEQLEYIYPTAPPTTSSSSSSSYNLSPPPPDAIHYLSWMDGPPPQIYLDKLRNGSPHITKVVTALKFSQWDSEVVRWFKPKMLKQVGGGKTAVTCYHEFYCYYYCYYYYHHIPTSTITSLG